MFIVSDSYDMTRVLIIKIGWHFSYFSKRMALKWYQHFRNRVGPRIGCLFFLGVYRFSFRLHQFIRLNILCALWYIEVQWNAIMMCGHMARLHFTHMAARAVNKWKGCIELKIEFLCLQVFQHMAGHANNFSPLKLNSTHTYACIVTNV